jgi:hypothetical protein
MQNEPTFIPAPRTKVPIKKNAPNKNAVMLLEDALITGQGFTKKTESKFKSREKKVTQMLFDNPIQSSKKKKKKRHRKSSVSKKSMSKKGQGLKVDEF